MKARLVLSLVALLAIAACSKSDSSSASAPQAVKSLEVSKATPSPSTGESVSEKSTDLTLSLVIDSAQKYDLVLPASKFGQDVQGYEGPYFYDLNSRCLDKTCENLAVEIAVQKAGGSPGDISMYQQEFLTVSLASGEMTKVVKRNGSTSTRVKLDDYLADKVN